MGLILIWIVFGVLCAIVASGKGRSGFGWFILGLLLGPLGFIASLVVGNLNEAKAAAIQMQEKALLVKCPTCAELIRPEAKKCKHCHEPIVHVDRFLNKNNSNR